MDIFILSCSAGLSTAYRVLQGAGSTHLCTAAGSTQIMVRSEITGNIRELNIKLVKTSRQTNRGVCSCWGDSALGGNFWYLYVNISGLGTTLLHPFLCSNLPTFLPTYQPSTRVDIFNFQLFLVSLQDKIQPVPCYSPPTINLFTL